MEQKYDIFISYRREGGDNYARTIQLELEKRYHVFLDFDELKDGVFDQRIMDAISEAPVFLLVLSHGALDRCVNENDWVRKEILYAAKCGKHIVPVTILDDNFEGIPSNLPEELKQLVGSHQFSELQMKTLFKSSMNELIRYRIEPYVQKQESGTGAEIHIDTDADCELFCFSEHLATIHANLDNIVRLNPGTYKLTFKSSKYPDIQVIQKYTIVPGMYSDVIEVVIKELVDLRDTIKPIEKDGKYGYADENDNVVIPCQWIEALEFSEELAGVLDSNYKWGFIDKTGKVVIPCKWKADVMDRYYFKDGLSVVLDENDKLGFIDKTGKLVIPCNWKDANDFSEGLACVMDDNYKWGFIDKNGRIIIPCKWHHADNFSEGLASVKDDNDKWGLIDKTGNTITPCQWKFLNYFSEGLASVKDDNDKWGFIDKRGKLVIPCKWKGERSNYLTVLSGICDQFIYTFEEGMSSVIGNNNKFGFIDKTGKLIIPCKWNKVEGFREGFACVKDDKDKWGFIDKTGKLIIPCKWYNVNSFEGGVARVQDDSGNWQYINKTGKVIEQQN